MRSNAILHKVITDAIPDTVGGNLIGLVTSREEIPELLKLDDVIDLVIPRGSNKLISSVRQNTNIHVLGHAGVDLTESLQFNCFYKYLTILIYTGNQYFRWNLSCLCR